MSIEVESLLVVHQLRTDNPATGTNAHPERHSHVGRAILQTYCRLRLLRQVPPPEDLCFYFLLAIQRQRCLICFLNNGLKAPVVGWAQLVEDHDHKTGMVRALLCRSCNIREGQGGSPYWKFYRRYAPANGWFYRYSGLGAQWSAGADDPVLNRVTSAATEVSERSFLSDPLDSLNRYIKFAEQKVAEGFQPSIRRWRFGDYDKLHWEGDPGYEHSREDMLLRMMATVSKVRPFTSFGSPH